MDKRGVNKWLIFFVLFAAVIILYFLFIKYVLAYLIKILPLSYTNALQNILIFIAVIILNYFFVKLSSAILKSYLETRGKKRDIKLFVSVYRYFMWLLVIFVTLSLLFRQIGSLITSIGLIGFGITLALQKPILNFVGWVTIVFGKSYKI